MFDAEVRFGDTRDFDKCDWWPNRHNGTGADLVLTDPPYGETSLGWDERAPNWVRAICYAAPQAWVFGSLKFFPEMYELFRECGWRFVQEIIWEKQNGTGFIADRPKRVHEFLFHFHTGRWGDLYIDPQYTEGHTRKTVSRKAQTPHTGKTGDSQYDSTSRLERFGSVFPQPPPRSASNP